MKKYSKSTKFQSVLTKLKSLKPLNFVFLFIAGVINAFGVMLFLFPVKLYDSGISGLSMLLDQITPPYLTISIFLLILNIPIFIFGIKRQGVVFTVYSLFTIGVYSLFSYLITYVFPIDVSVISPLAGSDLLLCAIFGGVISGVGSGLTIRYGGAIDGIDVLSVVFAKKIGISIGTFVMIFNCVLYIVCGIVLGSWILPLYSIVTYFVGSKTIDFIVDGLNQSKCVVIITDKSKQITDLLKEVLQSTGTIIDAKGGYSNEQKQFVYLIVNRFQIDKVRTIVHEIDANAFVSVHDVTDVYTSRTQD